jgi:CotH kinase protein
MVMKATRAPMATCRVLLALVVITSGLVGCGADAITPSAPAVEPPPVIQVQTAAAKLPELSITTPPGTAIVSKVTYLSAALTLTDTAGTIIVQGATEIRGRGNSTWEMPKKPYRLKLAASTSLLGMPASKHWVLLANYADKTMLRNDVAMALSRMVGMAWSPRSEFVDLRVNGEYLGVYQLIEHVRIAPERVNIPEMKVTDTSATAISGGYLIEVDERRGEDFCFNSTMTRMVFCVGNPETLLLPAWSRQRDYIRNYIARTDSAIFGARFADSTVGYAAYIDVESAVNYYLVHEILKNVDGNLRFSGYMYKKRDGKLTFGPVWDFDLSLGNVNYNGADTPDGWYARAAQWYTRLFQDPAFKARVAARWNEMQRDGRVTQLQRMVYSRSNYLSVVQVKNFERWPILGIWVWPNRVVTGSYDGEAIAMHLWLEQRLRWLDTEFAK